MSPVLEARGLAVDRGHRTVLRGVDLALQPGEGLALVGPNAAGKSTLVRALAGLLSPARGEVLLEGRPLASWPRSGLAQRVALVAAEDEAPDRIAVEDRVALGRYPHRGALAPLTAEDRAAVARALRQTETSHLARRPLGTLSAGERQLAALARGLAQEPAVLLLDEPATHLDVRHQLHLFRVLDDVRQCGVASSRSSTTCRGPRPGRRAWRSSTRAASRRRARRPRSWRDAAAERAFGVAIRGVPVGDGPERLWRFEERA